MLTAHHTHIFPSTIFSFLSELSKAHVFFSLFVFLFFLKTKMKRHTFHKQKGYIEDRRPASNCDPYQVSAKLMQTILVDEPW